VKELLIAQRRRRKYSISSDLPSFAAFNPTTKQIGTKKEFTWLSKTFSLLREVKKKCSQFPLFLLIFLLLHSSHQKKTDC
jgi:hypothetical protein